MGKSVNPKGFFNIPPGAIIPGTMGKFTLYLVPEGAKPVLFFKKGEEVSPDVFKRLSDVDVKNLYVASEDEIHFEKYVEDHLQQILET